MNCIPDSPIDDDRVSCDARSKLLNVLMQGFPKFDEGRGVCFVIFILHGEKSIAEFVNLIFCTTNGFHRERRWL